MFASSGDIPFFYFFDATSFFTCFSGDPAGFVVCAFCVGLTVTTLPAFVGASVGMRGAAVGLTVATLVGFTVSAFVGFVVCTAGALVAFTVCTGGARVTFVVHCTPFHMHAAWLPHAWDVGHAPHVFPQPLTVAGLIGKASVDRGGGGTGGDGVGGGGTGGDGVGGGGTGGDGVGGGGTGGDGVGGGGTGGDGVGGGGTGGDGVGGAGVWPSGTACRTQMAR